MGWVMLIGGMMIVAAVLMHERDAPWEWSFMWGFAEGSTRLGKAVGVLGIILLIGGGTLYLQDDTRESVAQTVGMASKPSACDLNCTKIEAAKEQFAVANNLKPGAVLTPAQVEQMGIFLQGGWSATRCRAGGAYQVGKIGEPPRCSVHGQNTP